MKLLLAIDFSDITPKLLQQAKSMALGLQAEVVMIHVAETNPDLVAYDFDPASVYAVDPAEIRDSIAERFHHEHKSLQDYADQLRDAGINCTALMIQGDTVDLLLQEAEKLGVDFIIAGTHGKGFLSQILLGSTSEDLLRKSPLPLYLVPADPA
jgi:nucleotide-binding universal stress UspA family protein